MKDILHWNELSKDTKRFLLIIAGINIFALGFIIGYIN